MTTLTETATDRLMDLIATPLIAVVVVLVAILLLTGLAGRAVLAIQSLQTDPSAIGHVQNRRGFRH